MTLRVRESEHCKKRRLVLGQFNLIPLGKRHKTVNTWEIPNDVVNVAHTCLKGGGNFLLRSSDSLLHRFFLYPFLIGRFNGGINRQETQFYMSKDRYI